MAKLQAKCAQLITRRSLYVGLPAVMRDASGVMPGLSGYAWGWLSFVFVVRIGVDCPWLARRPQDTPIVLLPVVGSWPQVPTPRPTRRDDDVRCRWLA
jgi:hypothetical protein